MEELLGIPLIKDLNNEELLEKYKQALKFLLCPRVGGPPYNLKYEVDDLEQEVLSRTR